MRKRSHDQSRQATVGKKTEAGRETEKSRETGKTAAEGLALAQTINIDPRGAGQESIAAGILVNAAVTL